MKTSINCLLTLLILIFSSSDIKPQSQTIVNGLGIELDNKNIRFVNPKENFDAVGMYRFGDSEWESYLCIFKFKDKY